MTNINLKHRVISMIIALALLVCTLPLTAIVSFAANEAGVCDHIDSDADAKCDSCDGFLEEPSGEVVLWEETTLDLTAKSDGYAYMTFTPDESGSYFIKALSSELDPLVKLYTLDGEYVDEDDDGGEDGLFFLEAELDAGVTYVVCLANYGSAGECTFVVQRMCDVHTPAGPAKCIGILCSVCEKYYGEINPDNHTEINKSNGTCVDCYVFAPDIVGDVVLGKYITVDLPESESFVFLNFIPSVSGEYEIWSENSTCDPYFYIYNTDGEWIYLDDDGGEGYEFNLTVELQADTVYLFGIYEREDYAVCTFKVRIVCNEHIPTDDVNCLGIRCDICDERYGEGNGEHTFDGDAICMGIFCSACEEYYGEKNPDNHIERDMDGFCEGCGVFAPVIEGDVALKEDVRIILPQENHKVFLTFVPTVSGTYKIMSQNSTDDPYLFIYDVFGNELANDDDGGEGYEFNLTVELQADTVYLLGIYERENDAVCNFKIYFVCEEHTPSNDVSCLGIRCDVCDELYGEGNDNHTPGGDADCRGTFCPGCEEFYGESVGEHTPSGDVDCRGSRCSVCDNFYGVSAYDHVDDDGDNRCDECDIIINAVEITVGEHAIPLVDDEYTYYKFTPVESGRYLFKSDSNYDPLLYIYDESGNMVGYGDDYIGYNFYVEVNLLAGETYFLEFYEYNRNNYCPVVIKKVCDVHTADGDATCIGTLCSICEEYYGETSDYHAIYELTYDTERHWGICGLCDYYYSAAHSFDDDDKCECGYFIHDCVFDGLGYDNPEVHFAACTLCGLMYTEEYYAHEYDESGVCECGRERFTEGIYIGSILLKDGQYLGNDGNISEIQPSGGYAYYSNGTLTLNNFEISAPDENPFGTANAIYSELDLVLVLVGENRLETVGSDTIKIAAASLTINGDGKLSIIAEPSEDMLADGIDITSGDFIINGGVIELNGSDHGIEIDYGNMTVDGCKLNINSGDEGIDITDGNFTVNGGIFEIYADDKGIDVGGNMTVNDGRFYVYSYNDAAIEVTEDLTITGGDFEVNAAFDGFEVSGNVTITDGNFYIDSNDFGLEIFGNANIGYGIFEISAYTGGMLVGGDLVLGNVIFDLVIGSEQPAIRAASIAFEGANDGLELSSGSDENGEFVYLDYLSFGTGDYIGKKLLKDFFQIRNCIYTGEEFKDVIVCGNGMYTLGVDYIVVLPEGVIRDVGVYTVKIVGIGDYVGEHTFDVPVHENYEITLDESIDVTLPVWNDDIWKVVTFTPEYDGTYEFIFLGGDKHYFVELLDEHGNRTKLFSGDENATVELELEAGVTYYFDVYADTEATDCTITVNVICDDHFGGEATYTEQASCDRCGEHYGEILVCDHMCHADGIRGFIWKIFDFLYELIGIESECECGAAH